jgi:uncharacterized membrane protein YeaQ/YmgE (transglycosylase-associated protein family)
MGPPTPSSESVRSFAVGILGWIVVGLIAGALATRVTRFDRRGCLFSIVVGVIGAVIGGALFNAAGSRGVGEFDLWSILVAFVGAVIFLLVLQALQRR